MRGLATVMASFGLGTGGFALTLRFDPRAGGEDGLNRYLTGSALVAVAARPDITGAHLMVADRAASTMVPVERKGRPTAIPNWIILVEGVSLDAVGSACDAHLGAEALRRHGAQDPVARDTYSLQLTVPRPGAFSRS